MFSNRLVLGVEYALRSIAFLGAIAVVWVIVFAPEQLLKLDVSPTEARIFRNAAAICFCVLMLGYVIPILFASVQERSEKQFWVRVKAQNERLAETSVMRLLFALSQFAFFLFLLFGLVSGN